MLKLIGVLSVAAIGVSFVLGERNVEDVVAMIGGTPKTITRGVVDESTARRTTRSVAGDQSGPLGQSGVVGAERSNSANFFDALGTRMKAYRRELQTRANSLDNPGYRRASLSEPRASDHPSAGTAYEAAENVYRHISAVREVVNENSGVLVLYGPVQGAEGTVVDVLGQEFDIAALGLNASELAMLVGRSAYVEAEPYLDGYSATRIDVFDDFAVPGATPVYVQGNLEDVNAEIGRIQIAGLEIDVTSIGSEGYETGSQLAIPGVQPLPGGLILGQGDYVLDGNLAAALSTSEVASIGGSSGRGIGGSSGRGIGGSSGRSIGGSSGRSIGGSSGRSIGGSSGRSIGGSSGR